jgi:hypothetical protein
MSPLSIEVPFPVFQDRDGQPLENGYVFLGVANLNPQTNPVIAYFDKALTIPAAQPLRTINGYISNAGTPAQVYVDGMNFSILVQDSKGSMIYNFPDGTGISPDACGVTYNPPFTNAVAYPVCEKLDQTVSVKDFGATGNGVTNDLTAIRNAIAALSGGGTLYFPTGNYLVNGKIEITANGVSILGDGRGATTITTNALTGDIIAVGSSISITRSNTISNLTITSVVARTDGASIHVAGAKATTIDNVEIRNGFDGIRVTSYGNQAQTVINNVLIENSTFFGRGMVFGETGNVCNEVFITQVTIADCWDGVKFFLCSGFYSSNVSIYTSRNVGVAIEPNAGQAIYGLQLSNWISDSSAVDGWLIGGLGKTAEVFLNNCYASSSGQIGFHLFVGVVLNTISLNDCISKRNGRIGMLINSGVNININGAFCSNNSISAINVYDGLVIGSTARRIFINGGYFGLGTFDEAFGNINYQRYGLGVEAGADYYSVIGTNAFGNQTAGFNNLTDNGTTKIAQINTSFP